MRILKVFQIMPLFEINLDWSIDLYQNYKPMPKTKI